MNTNISTLYNQSIYHPPIPYLVNTFICEYDMSKANINSLRSQDLISDEQYNYLCNADRMERQIYIGNMLRNDKTKTIAKQLKNGIINGKKMLFETNELHDHEILAIKNDAVFVIGRDLQYTEFGKYYKFQKKNVYTVFMKLQNLEVYYYDRFVNGALDINIDVKGIDDSLLPLHENGIIDIICSVCSYIQRGSIKDALMYITDIHERYINRMLPIEYYREFDYRSQYPFYTRYSLFYLNNIETELTDRFINNIDINRNLLIIRDIQFIISNIYTNMNRRG